MLCSYPVSNHNPSVRNNFLHYLLDLSLSFRLYSTAHYIGFKLSQCSTCLHETIVVFVNTKFGHQKFMSHFVPSEINQIIRILELIRFNSHDYNLENLRGD